MKIRRIFFGCVLAISLTGVTNITFANKIVSMVEFFSFKCGHCASVNTKLSQYVAANNISFLDVNIDREAFNTMIMYYISTDAGVGVQFKDAYFKAVSYGMEAYSPRTLNYVIGLVQNSTMKKLLKSPKEQQKIKLKMNYVQELINQYVIRATPTFLINQTTILTGEDVINSLIEAN